jgi:hypothetical protein
MNNLHNKRKISLHEQEGMTLVELILGSSILVIVVALTYGMWQMFIGSFYTTFDRTRDIPAANQTLAVLTREIREMRIGENGGYPLVIANDNELAFFNDVDNDGVAERVRYWLSGRELHKGVIEPEGTPAVYVEAQETDEILLSAVVDQGVPMFMYYNDDWPEDTVTNPLAVGSRLLDTTLISIHLAVRYAENDDEEPVEVSTSVALRGVKTNL